MTATQDGDHLCVLVHGLWGTPDHLKQVAAGIATKHHDNDGFHILLAHTNTQYLTYDGIDLGGERVAKETEEEIARLEKEGRKVTKISFVGYSLGGLIARYSIGLLYSRGLFDKIRPMNFTAFASPFLGVRAPYRGYQSNFWNYLGGNTIGTSGQQLFLLDKFRDTERPLLSILADSDSIFIKALSLFKNRALYANIVNDRSAPYFTTAISTVDEFEDITQVDLHPIDGYDGTILEPVNPVTPKSIESTYSAYWASTSASLAQNWPFYVVAPIAAVVGVPLFLGNAAVQSYRSTGRVTEHNKESAGFGAYRIPLLLQSAATAAGGQAKLDTNGNTDSESDVPTKEQISAAAEAETAASDLDVADGKMGKKPFPTLALAPEQFEMIKNLNALGWRKFRVHITKVRHSHAAIILRIDKPGYQEGRTVIKHWVDEEFEV